MGRAESDNDINFNDLIFKLKDWAKYFATKWIILLVVGIMGAVAGFVCRYFIKPMYVAEVSFALEEKGTGNPYAGIASQFGIDLASEGSAFSGDNSLELIKSRRMIEETLLTSVKVDGQDQLLINRFIQFSPVCEDWPDKPRVAEVKYSEKEPRENFTVLKDSLLKIISRDIGKNCLTVSKPDKKLNVVHVKCKAEDEIFAKYFVERLVQTASDFYIETKTRKSKMNVNLLENRVDSVRRALDSEIYGAAIYKDQNINVFRAQGSVQSARKQMNVQILSTMYGELIKNLELAKFTLMREEPVFQIIDYPILPLDNERVSKKTALVSGGAIAFIIALMYFALRRNRI
jgi:hypothetical protein